MQKVGEWWKGEGRGAEGRRVVERGGVRKVCEQWEREGRGGVPKCWRGVGWGGEE